MIEGWSEESYLVLFDPADADALSSAYALSESLPGYRLIGLLFWDDFIVEDAHGAKFTVPTVPSIQKYVQPFVDEIPAHDSISLRADGRFTGKIRWYITPLIFGGDPQAEQNISWIDLKSHAAAVKWWNQKYREVAAQ